MKLTIVQSDESTTPLSGGDLDTVGGGSDGHDGDTETEDETTSDKLGDLVGARDDDHSDDNKGSCESAASKPTASRYTSWDEWLTTAEHADTSSVLVRDGTSEEGSDHTTHTVHGEDLGDVLSGGGDLEVRLVLLHGGDTREERTIVSVGARSEEGHETEAQERAGGVVSTCSAGTEPEPGRIYTQK